MKQFFKEHIGIAVLLIIVLSFPVSLSTQARLNMRVIVTGLALDKTDSGYEITAQIVKTKPSSGASGDSASIEFISEQGETIVSAISKLSYKSGKVAGFSHTNFILFGKDMLEEDLNKSLNYFIRDTTIKDSILLVFSKESAKDEIQKTKDLGLSVGLGLQKVLVYKEKESDGIMTTLLAFMNDSLNNSQTSIVSELSLEQGTDSSESQAQTDKSTNEEQSAENSDAQNTKETQSQETEGETNQSSENSSGENNGKEESQYFKSKTPINCFVGGKFVGKLETEDEIMGFMLAHNKCKSEDISLECLNFGNLKNAKVGIELKYKFNRKKIRLEDEIPCLDMTVNIVNSSIREIQNDEFISDLSNSEFDYIKDELKKAIASKIAIAFEKSKGMGADVFGAYENANKFHYKRVKNKFESMQEFIEKLKLNVIVNVSKLEY